MGAIILGSRGKLPGLGNHLHHCSFVRGGEITSRKGSIKDVEESPLSCLLEIKSIVLSILLSPGVVVLPPLRTVLGGNTKVKMCVACQSVRVCSVVWDRGNTT